MTAIQKYLSELPEETKQLFIPVYGTVNSFYTVVYLIVRNEHITDQEKPDRYEDRLQVIRSVKLKMENQLIMWGLNGPEVVADIASDYFEDYVNYRDPELDITNEEFVEIVKQIMQG